MENPFIVTIRYLFQRLVEPQDFWEQNFAKKKGGIKEAAETQMELEKDEKKGHLHYMSPLNVHHVSPQITF